MARLIFPEFREEQSDSRYPFSDTATLRSNTGFFIPKNCIVDLNIYLINGDAGAFLASVVVAQDRVFLNFSDFSRQHTCVGIFTPSAFAENKYVTIPLEDVYGRPAGVLIGSGAELRVLSGWPQGPHTFVTAATELTASTVTPAKETGVRGLIGPAGELLAGDVWLIGDQGVVLRVLNDNNVQVNIIGAPLFKRIQCLDENGAPVGDFTPRNYLKTINGCPPDQYGNFNLTVKSHEDDGTIRKQILRIYPDNNGLTIAAVGSRVL